MNKSLGYIVIKGIVDNRDLSETGYTKKQVTKKSLRIEIDCMKEMLEQGEIAMMEWIQTEKPSRKHHDQTFTKSFFLFSFSM